MKKIIFIIIVLLFFLKVEAGLCFPEYTFLKFDDKIYYVKLEGFFQTLLEGPIYNSDLDILGSEQPCGEYNISEYEKLTVFDLNYNYIFNLFINTMVIFLPFLFYIYVVYRINNNFYLYTIGIIIFILFITYYFSLWY